VLGNAKSLKGDKNWGGLVASAKKRNLLMQPPVQDLKGFVQKHGAMHNEDDLSGSEDDGGGGKYGDDGDSDDEGAAGRACYAVRATLL
jgi:hypothetical protein